MGKALRENRASTATSCRCARAITNMIPDKRTAGRGPIVHAQTWEVEEQSFRLPHHGILTILKLPERPRPEHRESPGGACWRRNGKELIFSAALVFHVRKSHQRLSSCQRSVANLAHREFGRRCFERPRRAPGGGISFQRAHGARTSFT